MIQLKRKERPIYVDGESGGWHEYDLNEAWAQGMTSLEAIENFKIYFIKMSYGIETTDNMYHLYLTGSPGGEREFEMILEPKVI